MIETGGGRTKGWESLECLLSGAIADLFVTIALITADCSADGGMVGPLELETSLRQRVVRVYRISGNPPGTP